MRDIDAHHALAWPNSATGCTLLTRFSLERLATIPGAVASGPVITSFSGRAMRGARRTRPTTTTGALRSHSERTARSSRKDWDRRPIAGLPAVIEQRNDAVVCFEIALDDTAVIRAPFGHIYRFLPELRDRTNLIEIDPRVGVEAYDL